MRSERVVVRVVVLEGKAPAVQMKQFIHLSVLKSPVLVRCGTHPACLGCTRPPDEPLSFRTVWVLRLAVDMLHTFWVGEESSHSVCNSLVNLHAGSCPSGS